MSSGAVICTANIKTLFKAITDEAKDTVDDWANETMEISKQNFVPIKTGKLQSTGQVKTVVGTDREYKVELSYGEGIDYSIKQHEIPMYHEHGQDQYLSTPFNLRTGTLITDLKNNCGGVLK